MQKRKGKKGKNEGKARDSRMKKEWEKARDKENIGWLQGEREEVNNCSEMLLIQI